MVQMFSKDVSSKLPSAVLSILWVLKKKNVRDKEPRKQGIEREMNGERMVICRPVSRISDA